jgi:hypothetical protein
MFSTGPAMIGVTESLLRTVSFLGSTNDQTLIHTAAGRPQSINFGGVAGSQLSAKKWEYSVC